MNQTETSKIRILKYHDSGFSSNIDLVAIEEPIEISVMYWEGKTTVRKNISITMRTPGKDKELALGFLYTEGIINSFKSIEKVMEDSENAITIYLNKDAIIDLSKIERHFYTSSSCGVCGKSSIESLKTVKAEHVIDDAFTVSVDVLFTMNQKVRKEQAIFESTGGLHASALFDKSGQILGLFEDVGRHNALDKLIGHALLNNALPLNEKILFLSGRACYELIQKAAMAGIPFICALGAPSSLAIELALEFNITLIGFLKKDSFNVYSCSERIRR